MRYPCCGRFLNFITDGRRIRAIVCRGNRWSSSKLAIGSLKLVHTPRNQASFGPFTKQRSQSNCRSRRNPNRNPVSRCQQGPRNFAWLEGEGLDPNCARCLSQTPQFCQSKVVHVKSPKFLNPLLLFIARRVEVVLAHFLQGLRRR
jgi:hypothetical protein